MRCKMHEYSASQMLTRCSLIRIKYHNCQAQFECENKEMDRKNLGEAEDETKKWKY